MLRGRLASRAIVRSRATMGAHVAGGLGLTSVLIVRLKRTIGTRATRHVGQARGLGFWKMRVSVVYLQLK